MKSRRNALLALGAIPLAIGGVFIKKNSDAIQSAGAGDHPDHLKGLNDLLARQKIEEILYLYARGWDRLDEEALRSCFFEDSDHQHGSYKGKSHAFIGAGMKYIRAKTTSTSHLITNPLIEISGDKAVSECLFFAHHRRMNKAGTEQEDYFIKGRYLDTFEKRNGLWKISARRGLHDFERIVPRADQTLENAPKDQLSAYKPTDPLYELLGQLHMQN